MQHLQGASGACTRASAAGPFLRLRNASILLLCVLVATLGVIAQERFSEVTGTVMDATGAVLPTATVTITNKETGRVYTTKTGQDGLYAVRDVQPGRYKVRIETQGFTPYEIPDATVLLGRVFKLDATLQVSGTEQSVQVTEAAPLIDTTTTAVAHNVTSEEFNRLPKTRSFQSLALTSPSVNSGDIEGGYQVNGASGAENQFTVDGMSTNSAIDGRSRQNAAYEFLQEVQVKTSGIEAQYGGAMGGVISAITRSGGNDFHGDLHYYFAGTSISAGPVKRLLLDPRDELTLTYQQDNKGDDASHEFGYALGGPILKNKLYFFSSASPRFQNRERTYLTFDNQRDVHKSDVTFWQAFNKISYDPTNWLRTNVAFLWSPSHTEGIFPAYDFYGNGLTRTYSAIQANKTRGWFSPQSSYTGNVDIILNSSSVLSLRGGRWWDNFKAQGVPAFSAIEYATSGVGLPFNLPSNLQNPQGFSTTPRTRQTSYDLVTRTTFQADYSKFFRWAGSHDLKIGAGRLKNVNRVDDSYPGGGFVQIYWDQAFTRPGTSVSDRGTYGYYAVQQLGTIGTTGGTIDNMYIQDRWRLTSRLTLDVGLRTENEYVPSFRRDIKDYAFKFNFQDKLAPRLGASYDLYGDGRVKLYASWGLFYDWVKYELARGTFGGDFWTTRYRSLDTLDILSLSGTNTPGRNIWDSSDPNSYEDHRIPSFDLIDPNIKPMSTMMTNAGVEWQFRPDMVFAARYTRNQLRRTIEDLGVLVNGNEEYTYGNPGEGIAKTMSSSTATGPIDTPKPKRTYDALEFSVTKRFSRSWFASGSYVWSRLYGNYAGLGNSDEVTPPSTGLASTTSQQSGGSIARPGTSGSRAWDSDEIIFDSRGQVVEGRLATDRPHVFKLYGSYTTPWHTEIGGFFFAQSGTPVSTYVNTLSQIPVFVEGRGDLGRTPFLSQTNMIVAQEFRMGETKRFRLEFNADNLFNQKTARYIFPYYNRGAATRRNASAMNLSAVNLKNGYDWKALVAMTPEASTPKGALDPRYGMQDAFSTGFAGRFMLKFIF